MRECCGSNNHPDSTLFVQMFKLLSTYSLVKPPRGCNVEGNEISTSLLSLKDISNTNKKIEEWEGLVDSILDRGTGSYLLAEASEIMFEHDCSMSETSEYAVAYIAGYISRRRVRFAKYKENNKFLQCHDCIKKLVLAENDVISERHKLIE